MKTGSLSGWLGACLLVSLIWTGRGSAAEARELTAPDCASLIEAYRRNLSEVEAAFRSFEYNALVSARNVRGCGLWINSNAGRTIQEGAADPYVEAGDEAIRWLSRKGEELQAAQSAGRELLFSILTGCLRQ